MTDLPRWRVFPPLALGTLMATLDISVVNIALPTIARRFGATATTVDWVVLAYVLAITGVLLTLGRIADAVGRRRVYATGLVVFTAGSALCAAAGSLGWLVAARAVQGLGAAMMTANSTALLVSNFPGEERGRAIGAFGATVGVGLALGPPLGGLLVATLSWRWIFLVNLPLGVLAFVQLRRRVPADAGAGGRPDASPAGAIAWCAALVALMLALTLGPRLGFAATPVLALAAAGVIAVLAFAWSERRAHTPLLPLDLLRGPVGAAALLTLLSQALSLAVGIHLPMVLENVLGMGTGASGGWLAVMPVLALFAAPLAGRISDAIGPRVLSVVGLALTAAGFAVLAALPSRAPAVTLACGLALVGAGLGLFTVPNSSALFGAAPPERFGAASGLQATMRNLGFTAGAALMAAAIGARYAAHAGAPLPAAGALDRAAFVAATREAFLGMAALALLGVALAARRDRRGSSQAAPAG
ncbi:MAG TPA: MFS transporter [Candidatus Eisenbacteria bacterium]|nr:MFS transporter [Candidatus Eisenbacteria bacterium]